MNDRLARTLAATALAVALVAAVLAGYSLSVGLEYREGLRTLSSTLQDLARRTPGRTIEVPLHRPPVTIETDDR